MDPFARLVKRLRKSRARFVVIGVGGANYYARSAGLVFTTLDRDLFLPPEPGNLLRAWRACVAEGVELSSNDEPLGSPLDRFLAERAVSRRALVSAVGEGLQIDLAVSFARAKRPYATKT